jgi:hypothetical protein
MPFSPGQRGNPARRASKDVDHPNRIVLADPVFEAFRKQHTLPAIRPVNEAPHSIARGLCFHTPMVIFDATPAVASVVSPRGAGCLFGMRSGTCDHDVRYS